MLPGYLNWFPSFYERYKINKEANWPWERPNWKLMRRKMIYNLIINQVFIFPFFLSLSSIIGVKQRFTNFPSFWEMFWQLCVIYFLDDLFFYWGHRTFHTFKSLYKMHKIHHEYDKVFTFTTEYFHPFDYAIANVVMNSLLSYRELQGSSSSEAELTASLTSSGSAIRYL
jgi:sterol desaturase/sphingolipid hydroxylase (fatty acid hydroxylase superfamily)